MGLNRNVVIHLDFWLSAFVILLVGNFLRRAASWNGFCTAACVCIALIVAQYCFLHARKMRACKVNVWAVCLAELGFILAGIFVVLANTLWLAHTHEVNFAYVAILAVLLCPMIVINTKALRRPQ